jgi:hypothetical protein
MKGFARDTCSPGDGAVTVRAKTLSRATMKTRKTGASSNIVNPEEKGNGREKLFRAFMRLMKMLIEIY